MRNWERFEIEVAGLVKGKRTPGSGNKGILGDVFIPGRKVHIECKQTDTPSLTIEKLWLRQLEDQLFEGYKVAFAVAFGLRGYVYLPIENFTIENPVMWKTLTLREEALPEFIYSALTKWQLCPLEDLRGF